MISIPKEQILPVNSVSYVDMLGVLAGLERLPAETSDQFSERIELALSAARGPDYAGLVNSLSLAFGLEMREVMRITGEPDLWVECGFGVLHAGSNNHYVSVWLLRVAEDDFWEWKKISEVVAELAEAGVSVEMIGADGPAFQLLRQSNTLLVTAEDLSGGKTVRLAHGKLVEGSESFSNPVPSYTVGSDGQTLQFAAPLPEGTTVTYRRRVSPYTVIAAPLAAFSLLEPGVRTAAQAGNGRLVYQAREYLQEILLRDGSYWGK